MNFPTPLDPAAMEHFRAWRWVRVAAAFERDAAAAMCAVIWNGLAKAGIQRDDPSTWTKTLLVAQYATVRSPSSDQSLGA